MFFRRIYKEEIMKKLVGTGGLLGYLGTNDAVKVEQMIQGAMKKPLHL